jgi:hypothetical protein
MLMNRLSFPIRGLGALTVIAVLGLAGCSDHLAPPTPLLTKAQADTLGDAMVASAQSELDAATATGASSFAFGMAPASGSAALSPPPSGCFPTVSPTPIQNSDGDPVPDSVRLEWTSCVITFRRGSDEISGAIDIVDPTPATTDRARRQRFTDFARTFTTDMGRMRSITLNGVRMILSDADSIVFADSVSSDFQFGDGSTASNAPEWAAIFRADVPGSIVHDFGLPSGTLTIDGSSTWTRRDGSTYELQVSTPTALHHDATCTDRPKFDAGQLDVVATKDGATSTVTIDFTACGQYTVTKS